jgi:predicted lipoprotein with Yx(FWY)xxD motif
MRRHVLLAAAFVAFSSPSIAANVTEDYVRVPMPPGFQVINTELEGNVFADAKGRTLYEWPLKPMRVGTTGDPAGKSLCTDKVEREEGGHQSPYPAGMLMPDLETRPSCAQMWPPVLAENDALPVGDWTIVTRPDGNRQWAYNQQPLYTAVLDRKPGDTIGGTKRDMSPGVSARPAVRNPIGPPPSVPPGFDVLSTVNGRLLVVASNSSRKPSLYTFEKDTAKKSACVDECLDSWIPALSPAELALPPSKEWGFLERSPGVRQWVFRGKPVYTHVADMGFRADGMSVEGSDTPGWSLVYTQVAPEIPSELKRQVTIAGETLADARGRTIYLYFCQDDADDQLPCDHPETTQVFRMGVCGGGDAERCKRRFPLVLASAKAKSASRAWSVMDIDPMTGRIAQPGDTGAVRAWAYRDRPLYTFDGDPAPKVGDRGPGDFEADGLGEWKGQRHGYTAFWLRDDFYGRTN